MFPCGAQGRVSLLPTATAEPQATAPAGAAAAEGSDDAMLRMIQGMLQAKAMNPDSQQ